MSESTLGWIYTGASISLAVWLLVVVLGVDRQKLRPHPFVFMAWGVLSWLTAGLIDWHRSDPLGVVMAAGGSLAAIAIGLDWIRRARPESPAPRDPGSGDT